MATKAKATKAKAAKAKAAGPGNAVQLTAPNLSRAEQELLTLQRQKRNGYAAWWSIFVPKIIVLGDDTEKVVCQCTKCGAHVGTSNTTVQCGGHYNTHERQSDKLEAEFAAASQAGTREPTG